MDSYDQYRIPINSITAERQEYSFEIDKNFFYKFPDSEIQDMNIQLDVLIQKVSSSFTLEFYLEGTVSVQCDRCLDYFDLPVEFETTLFVKMGEQNSDLSDIDDTLILSFNETEIDLVPHIFEYIHLSVPIRHVHPDNARGKSTCNKEMLKKLDNLAIKEEPESDPRWDELKKLMSN